MRRLFNQLSISKKLVLSFSLVILIFVFVSVGTISFFTEASARYNNIFNYVIGRSEILGDHFEEFSFLRRETRATVLSLDWQETVSDYERQIVQEDFLAVNERLRRLEYDYFMSLASDPFLNYEPRAWAFDLIYRISESVRSIYHHIINNYFSYGVYFSLEYHPQVDLYVLYHIENVEVLSGLLRRANSDAIIRLQEDISRLVNATLTTNVVGAIFSAAVATLMTYFIVSDLRKRIGLLNKEATEVRQGNFDGLIRLDGVDEISQFSNLMADMVTSFKRLIGEVNSVSLEIANGNDDTRIDSQSFHGGYKDAADAVNMLIEKVKDARLAELNSQAKSKFLASMSHEIRTPMNAILGITEIQLQSRDLSENMKEAFEKIYLSGDMLLSIINDILDLSKIEAGKMEIFTARYEVASLINDTIVLNTMRIESRNIEFIISVDETIPAYLYGDELRIKQILNNVLSNAFKYTEQGYVYLSVSAETNTESQRNVKLIFTVSDTGQGMTEEQTEKLFDSYSRFNLDSNRYTEGTGLGMSITSNLLNLMDGSISVTSQPGKGSSFTISIPQERFGQAIIGKDVAESLINLKESSRSHFKRVLISQEHMPYGKVLIVDDLNTNIFVAKGLLAPYALSVDAVESGADAVERVKAGNKYDIIFMDHMMPVMDGIETVSRIRALGYAHPIIALTANAVSGQMDIFLNNGFDDFLSKPIDIRQLNIILNKWVRDKHPVEVVESARQQAAERAREKQPTLSGALDTSAVFDMVYKDFLKNRRENIAEITNAVLEGNLEAAAILAHTLKNLAALIEQQELMKLAGKAEAAFLNKDIPSETIHKLSAEFDRVLSYIEEKVSSEKNKTPQESELPAAADLDKNSILEILNNLVPLLEAQSFEALDLSRKLEGLPSADILIQQVEDIDFTQALETIVSLRKNLEV